MFKTIKLVVAILLSTSFVLCKRDDHADVLKKLQNDNDANLSEKFENEGIEPWEIEDEMRLYTNMFKWRYSNLLPHQFRREYMIAITLDLLKEIRPKLKIWSPSLGLDKNTYEKIQLIFVSKFWFSNLAWLNETKRFFKEQLRIVSGQQINVIVAEQFTKMNQIARKDKNGKINEKNYDMEKENAELIKAIDEGEEKLYNQLANFLKKDAKTTLDIFIKDMDQTKLEQEFEYIKSIFEKDILHWQSNLYPFEHLNMTDYKDAEGYFTNDQSLDQGQAYIFDYQLPDKIKVGDQVVQIPKNQGVHPDRYFFTFKDEVLFNWIEDAFATSFAIDPNNVIKSEYKLTNDLIKKNVDDYWDAQYRINFEADFEKMQDSRASDYTKLTQPTDYHIEDHLWESDLDLTDQDLDPIYIQAKAYQKCMEETGKNRDKSTEGFFKTLDKMCSEYAPDLIKVDHKILQQQMFQHEMATEQIDWNHFDEAKKHWDYKNGAHPQVQSRRALRQKSVRKTESNTKKVPSLRDRIHAISLYLMDSIYI